MDNNNNDAIQIGIQLKSSKQDLVEIAPFQEYLEKMEQNPRPVPTYVETSILNENTSFDLVRQKLSRLDLLKDQEIKSIIDSNFSYILKDIFENNNKNMVNLFMDNRFLTIFTAALYGIEPCYTDYVYCNRIAYDYIALKSNGKDQITENLMFNMARVLNRKYIHILVLLNLDEKLALMMLIARYSSLKENVNVKRLNCIITNQSPELMTEEMIVQIWNKLFQKITPLFEGVMFDVWDSSELEEESKRDIYSFINLAILNTLNSLDSVTIRQVLINYYQLKNYVYPDKQVRFNINCFSSDDYPRLRAALDDLAIKENKKF